MPTFSVTAWRGTERSATWRVSPNGIEANATRAKKTDTNGASSKSRRSARAGRKSSLVSIFSVSARGWNRPRARTPKMDARLAPMRSCMIADCLRSTQPRRAATFRTKSIMNATRPNAMPRSIIGESPVRLGRRGPSPATSCGSHRWTRRSHGEQPPRVPERLVAEPREGGHGRGELAEPVLRASRRRRLAQGRQHPTHDLPFGQRLAEWLDRLPEALHAALEIRVRPVALDPGRRREHPVGADARAVDVGAGEDDRLDGPQRLEHLRFGPRTVQEVVSEDPKAADLPAAGGVEDGARVVAQAQELGAQRVRVLVGADQEVVLVARHPWRHLARDAPDRADVQEATEREEVLVRHLGRRDDADCLRRHATERRGDGRDRLVPRRVADRLALTVPGYEESVRVVDEPEPVAPGVAEPPAVDVRVEARLEPRDPAPVGVMRPTSVHVRVDVAAARASGAHGLGRLEVPHAHLEAEVAVGQRADRTDVHDVARILVVELSARKEPDLGVVATLEDAQLPRAGDLVAEAHAARAEDASLGVEDDVRPEGYRLRLVHLLVRHPRIVEAVLHVVDLEPALAGLVADRAVERVIDQVELHDRLARLAHPVGLREDDHAVGGDRVAGDRGPRRLLEVDHAETTLAGDREAGVIAIVRDLDAGAAGGLDEVGPGRDLDLLAIDRELGHRYLGTSASNSPRNFSM